MENARTGRWSVRHVIGLNVAGSISALTFTGVQIFALVSIGTDRIYVANLVLGVIWTVVSVTGTG
jgi:hypothetical protein